MSKRVIPSQSFCLDTCQIEYLGQTEESQSTTIGNSNKIIEVIGCKDKLI